ncbi:hypothetical protein CRG98_024036, partial [Punica granatum]
MESLSSLLSSPSPPISFSPRKFSSSTSAFKAVAGSLALAPSSSSSSSTASPQRRKPRTSAPKPKLPKAPSPHPTELETVAAPGTTSAPRVPTKKVLVPIAFGTEEMEAVVLIDVLRRAGADVAVASVEPQLQVEASGGVKLVADTCISECCNDIFDLVVLP